MRKMLVIGLAAVLLAALVPFAGACAEYIPVKLELSVSPSILAGPRNVEVTVKVSNIGDSDLAGNASLYGPDGKIVTDFGDGGSTMLKMGAVYTCKTVWRVTEGQLGNGKLTYSLKYPAFTDEGEKVTRSISQSVTIRRSVPDPEIIVKRSLSANMAAKGQPVTITYDIENNGELAIESIKITEHRTISTKSYSIAKLEPGQIGRAEFQVTMGEKDLTSEATITYKVPGNSKTYTYKEDAATIQFGSPSLSGKLESSATSAMIDNTVKLKLTLSNTGNVDYQNIRVSDALLGEIFINQQVAAKQTLTLEKEVTMRENQSFAFTVEAMDSTGNAVSFTSNKVSVAAVDPSKQMDLVVTASASSQVIYSEPGVLTFRVSVKNAGEVDAKDVKVTCGTTLVHSFAELKAGEEMTFSRLVSATQAGQFQFTATTKDQLNNTVAFSSEIIPITFSRPTPLPTEVPTPPIPTLKQEEVPTKVEIPAEINTLQSALQIGAYLFSGLTIIAVALFLTASVRRMHLRRQSSKAYDHLERAGRRDYSLEHSPREQDKKAEMLLRDSAEEQDDKEEDDDALGTLNEDAFASALSRKTEGVVPPAQSVKPDSETTAPKPLTGDGEKKPTPETDGNPDEEVKKNNIKQPTPESPLGFSRNRRRSSPKPESEQAN